MAHRLAPQARAELDNIWNYIAKESGSIAAADGVVDAIVTRFYLLAQHPYMGRSIRTANEYVRCSAPSIATVAPFPRKSGCQGQSRCAAPKAPLTS